MATYTKYRGYKYRLEGTHYRVYSEHGKKIFSQRAGDDLFKAEAFVLFKIGALVSKKQLARAAS